jgi:hypothetical protein
MTTDVLQGLAAKQELYELSCRYMRGVDRLDRQLLRSVFHDDAKCDYGFYVGDPDGFADYALRALSAHLSNQHLIGNALYELEGDTAFGEVYFQAYHRIRSDAGETDLFIAGRYVDRYLRRDGVWRIAFRAEVNDWSRTVPAADGYRQRRPNANWGARLDDLVYQRERMF